jgi:hypothetical protein
MTLMASFEVMMLHLQLDKIVSASLARLCGLSVLMQGQFTKSTRQEHDSLGCTWLGLIASVMTWIDSLCERPQQPCWIINFHLASSFFLVLSIFSHRPRRLSFSLHTRPRGLGVFSLFSITQSGSPRPTNSGGPAQPYDS